MNKLQEGKSKSTDVLTDCESHLVSKRSSAIQTQFVQIFIWQKILGRKKHGESKLSDVNGADLVLLTFASLYEPLPLHILLGLSSDGEPGWPAPRP